MRGFKPINTYDVNAFAEIDGEIFWGFAYDKIGPSVRPVKSRASVVIAYKNVSACSKKFVEMRLGLGVVACGRGSY